MKKTIMVLNAIALLFTGLGALTIFVPDLLPAIQGSKFDVGVILSMAGLATFFLVKPSVKSWYKKREWDAKDINEKIKILAADLKSGKRFWVMRKFSNTNYFFEPVPYDQISGVCIGTDPYQLRELLRLNQIHNNVTTEGILDRLGYYGN